MAKMKFDPEQPVIVLNVTLEGQTGTKRMVKIALDTGATYTMIPWEIAEALGYEPEHSKEKVTLVTASGIEGKKCLCGVRLHFLQKIRIGKLNIRAVESKRP